MNVSQKPLTKQKREAIMSAAKRAFMSDGAQATSMDRLAELAQVSKRTLYNHFPAKEDLVLQVLSELWVDAKRDLPPYNPAEPIQPQLLRLVTAEVEFAADPNLIGLSRVAVGLFLHRPEALEGKIAEQFHQEDSLTAWLRAAVASNQLQEMDVTVAAVQLHRLIKGACYWPQLLNLEAQLQLPERQALAEQTVEIFLARYISTGTDNKTRGN